MFKGFKNILMAVAMLVATVGATGALAVADNTTAYAASQCKVDDKNLGTGSVNPDDVLKSCKEADTLVSKLIMFAKVIVGFVIGIAVIMIAYAGFKYATSQGDIKATENAKMQIVSAGIGIGVGMLAFVILNLFQGIAG